MVRCDEVPGDRGEKDGGGPERDGLVGWLRSIGPGDTHAGRNPCEGHVNRLECGEFLQTPMKDSNSTGCCAEKDDSQRGDPERSKQDAAGNGDGPYQPSLIAESELRSEWRGRLIAGGIA